MKHLLQKSKFSIFHDNIFKYMIFQRCYYEAVLSSFEACANIGLK